VNENGVIVGLARTAGIQRAMMWTRRERPRDLTIDFGPMHGAFRYANGAFTPVHWLSPEASVRADLDANPVDDLVVDFGAGVGLWALSNGTSWTALHPFSPERMAAGDLDGNGQDDLVLDFAGYGLWVLHNNTNWTHLHTMSPTHLAVGDVNGWGGEDVVIYLPGHGLWVFENNLAWRQLYEGEITLLHIADIEGDGGEEVIVNIPGQGLRLGPWNWRALNDNPATFVASGDVDGGRTDLLISFPGYGTWLFRNGGTWVQVHLLEAEDAAFIDLDGNGNDAIVLDFGPPHGLWTYRDDGTWQQLHGSSSEGLVSGQFH
jgi:hypothetical protein